MHWGEWAYADWNRRLLEHHFVASGSELREPIERIPATPEELALAVGDSAAAPAPLQEAFVNCVRRELPFGEESFSGYCLGYGGWSPSSQEYPHFFGMLWLTCLVAYGYPTPNLAFYPRLWAALGKKDNLQFRQGNQNPGSLPVLWTALRDWTRKRRAAGASVRELHLPADVGRRKAIGISWFLAFPHQLDRLELSKCLWEHRLVGPEPPIDPVVSALQARREKFSPEFREDLDDFVRSVLDGRAEATSSAFWRAVRQEALNPSTTSDGQRLESRPQAGIVVFGGDEGLRPVLCGPVEWQFPQEYEGHELDEPVGKFTRYFTTQNGELVEPAERALVLHELVGIAHRGLIQQGILVLREIAADIYAVVSGTEVNGARLALVRDDRRDAFQSTFGGTITKGLIDGWWEVTGCVVRRLKVLPPALDGATQLLATMQPPTIAIAGGIRVPEGFYKFDAYLPHVHAYGAERVWLERGELPPLPCAAMQEVGEWALPATGIPKTGTVTIKAEWSEDGGSGRVAESTVTFVDWVLDDEPKPLRKGTYLLEGCGTPEIEVQGGASVPLDMRIDYERGSVDLLELEGTARYLGPGLGEMSLQPGSGFDWMAVGPNKNPDVLVFVGDPTAPTPPAHRRSPDPGDRRNWSKAFGKGVRAVVRTAPGNYASIEEFPLVAQSRAAYAAHHDRVSQDAPACPETNLKGLEAPDGLAAQPAAVTVEAINALTALSVRKGGLTYKDASVVIEPLVGSQNPLAVQQLLRAWSECGLLDIVRDVVGGRLTIVARPPSLVMVRRGPEVEATVFGLVSSHREHELSKAVEVLGRVRHLVVKPPNQYQPNVHRIRGDLSDVQAIAARAGVGAGGWLAWPHPSRAPEVFSVQRAIDRLPSSDPPSSYRLNAVWDWDKRVFERRGATDSRVGVQIQRRTHNDGTSIHVVQSDGKVVCWSYLRGWSLLFGYELSGNKPFRRDARDALACSGLSPLNLPLPIARLCTVIGAGLPGPRFAGHSVVEYSYPFGRRLYRLIQKVIPPAWVQGFDEGQ